MDATPDVNANCVYIVRRVSKPPNIEGPFDGGSWEAADTLRVDHFHPRSSEHHPQVRAKLLHDDRALYVQFDVRDRYVVCVHTEYQGPVCRDSCVECFLQPKRGKGYFNFEVNCGGHLLLSYVEDPTRTADGFKKFTKVPWDEAKAIRISHSLSGRVFPEINEEIAWHVGYAIPFTLFEAHVGPLGEIAGQEWRGNLYKCADDSSHPHWATWAPIGEELNFHQPQFFGTLRVE